MTLGVTTNALQSLVNNGKLEYYSLSMPSLEQIFISFAKQQQHDTDDDNNNNNNDDTNNTNNNSDNKNGTKS